MSSVCLSVFNLNVQCPWRWQNNVMGPQLLTMKEQVPLVKMSSSRPGDQVDSDNNNLGESNMITEKVFNVFKPLKIVK